MKQAASATKQISPRPRRLGWSASARAAFWREADIPTNGLKVVAAEPGGSDQLAARVSPASLRISLASIVILCVHYGLKAIRADG